MEAAGPGSTTGDDTLMVADGLGRSLMEEDWPDNTDEADRSISHPTAHPELPPPPTPAFPHLPRKTEDFINLVAAAATVSSSQEKVKTTVYFTETESPVLRDVLPKGRLETQ